MHGSQLSEQFESARVLNHSRRHQKYARAGWNVAAGPGNATREGIPESYDVNRTRLFLLDWR